MIVLIDCGAAPAWGLSSGGSTRKEGWFQAFPQHCWSRCHLWRTIGDVPQGWLVLLLLASFVEAHMRAIVYTCDGEVLDFFFFNPQEENHRIEEREWMDWKFVIHLFEFKSEEENFIICGLTARILIRVASIIYQRTPPFQEHFPDFQRLQASLINPTCLCNINSSGGEETCGK